MTNESISGFLNSIAEAKRAFDAEPDYQRRIQSLSDDINRLQSTVASRELRIHDLKQNEETLTAKLRSVEAERDDAGFRALEEADKVQNLLSVVQRFIADGLAAVSAVEGTVRTIVTKADLDAKDKEISELQWKASETDVELQRLKDDMRLAQEQLTRPFAGATSSSNAENRGPSSDPFASTATSSPPPSPSVSSANVAPADGVHTTTGEDPFLASGSDPIPQGLDQSEKDPISNATVSNVSAPAVDSGIGTQEGQSDGPFASSVTTGNTLEPQTASSTSAESETSVVSSASPPERNRDRSTFFTGRKYFDVTYFVPLHQWLDQGGTRDDYYWRPAEANVPLPEASQASHRS